MPLRKTLALVPSLDPRESALAHTIGQPDLLCRVLLARGLDDPNQIRAHLRPRLDALSDPFAFTGMARAVDRVKAAVANGETIVVHGDYDVDGISGTVLLLKLFAMMEVDVKPFIPARADGYSFTDASVKFVEETGAKLCISVDNGTNAIEKIAAIQALGCDVIVTDHHGTTENTADAFALLNPRLPDAGYPDRELAGVGVAFRLAAAVSEKLGRAGREVRPEFRDFLIDALAYVALGTVADVAPLRNENRVLVHHGLRALTVSKNPGIRALLESAGVSHRSPDAEDIAFRIGPLINAAGRVGHAQQAIDLLMAPGYQEAQEAAKVLEQLNTERRRIEHQLAEHAIAEADASDDRIIVLGGDGWHPGVLGIVAARIAETVHKPAILIAFDGDRGRGSGRSPGGIHLREALGACSEHLLAWGGHAAAAGLEIERSKLDVFRRRINEVAVHALDEETELEVDGPADLAELDARIVRKLDQLGPFGVGNRRPTFVTEGVRLVGHPFVDSRGRDLRFRVTKDGTMLPVRARGAARRFETIRELTGPFTLVHQPRLGARTEDGPVELLAVQVLDQAGKAILP
jgi:single-stranded-DNA-specific exonuclease